MTCTLKQQVSRGPLCEKAALLIATPAALYCNGGACARNYLTKLTSQRLLAICLADCDLAILNDDNRDLNVDMCDKDTQVVAECKG